MKDQGMPLGDFRFGFAYEPCSPELKARLAREAGMARLEVIDQRVKAQLRTEAHDRIGQSMALAAQIRKQGYTAKTPVELETLWQQAAAFDQRTAELVKLGWLESTPEPCTKFVSKVLNTRGAQLAAAKKAAHLRQRNILSPRRKIAPKKKDSSNPLPLRVLIPHGLSLKAHLRVKAGKLDSR